MFATDAKAVTCDRFVVAMQTCNKVISNFQFDMNYFHCLRQLPSLSAISCI